MAAGIFTSRDAYAGRIGDILSQNRYTYAENNPVTYADPSGHISIKSAWNAVKTGAKTAASAARAVTSAVTAAVKTGASAVSNAIKGAASKPAVKLGNLSSKTVNQTPSAYAKVSGASRNQAVQQKAAKSAAWADLAGQPVSMCEAAAAWADWGAEKAAGYVDESLIGNGAMLAALKVKAAECWAYSQLENSIHLIIPEADVERMLRGAGLMLGGGFKSFGGFMLALGSSTISWTGLGVLGMGAGAFVVGAGASDMNQGAEEFFLGMSGDSTTPTRNGMSDLFYDGNDTIYHLSTGTAAMAGGMMTPYVNAHAAKMAAVKSTAGKPAVTKPTVAEAAGGTADDALEQFYDDIFESSYGEQFDPVKEQAIVGPGEAAGSGSVTINPNEIRYSQSSVNGSSEIIVNMKQNGWKGAPIDVVEMPDGVYTTIDNTRVVSAREAGIDVQATVHNYNDPLPIEYVERFTTKKGVPMTWGEAIELRIGKQKASFRTANPFGSFEMESIK